MIKIFFFDQAFIRGQNLNDFVQNSEKGLIEKTVQKLFDSISELHRLDQKCIQPLDLLSHLADKIQGLSSSDGFKIDLWERLRTNILSAGELTASPYIHGDLTQENILIKDDHIFFIDLYESYTNCCLVDFSKLFFDLRTGWSSRNGRQTVSCLIKRHYFLTVFEANICSNLKELINLLAILDLERVLPYCNDKDRVYLSERRGVFCEL